METKIHKCKFYSPKPKSINCISYNRKKKRIAIGRNEASIEIWDLNDAPLLLAYMPGVKNGSVEALAWCEDRLFSTGLGGSLVEWDLINLCVKQSVLLTGYAAWCLDIDPSNTHVVIGTEQGYINKYSIENDQITYSMLFDKQEDRVMCCKYDKTGNIIVTASMNTIRIWNAQTGHAVKRISARRRGKDVIVWCIAVLSDLTIISGDSNGRLSFWDGSLGEQIESFPTHKQDILAITVSDDERSLYCSGVDSVIVNFVKVAKNQGSEMQWMKNVQRHIHEHDVRALMLQDDKLLSLGADAYLTFSSYPPKWVMRMPQMIPTPRSNVSEKKKLLLLRYNSHIEIWKMGTYLVEDGKLVYEERMTNVLEAKKDKHFEDDVMPSHNYDNTPAPLKVSTNAFKLITINTINNQYLKCCGMSPDGKYVFYSTESKIRILKLELDEDDERNIALTKVPLNSLPIKTCEKAAFTEDSANIILSSSRVLYVLQIDPQTGVSVQQTIPTESYFPNEFILHLTVSQSSPSGTTYLVAGDTSGAVVVWSRRTNSEFEHYVNLPKYQCASSAILIDHVHETLISVYVNHKIIEYDLIKNKVLSWTAGLTNEWYKRSSAVTAIHLHPRHPDQLLLEDYNSLSIITKPKNSSIDEGEPRQKKSVNKTLEVELRVIPVKYLAAFHWLASDEAVIVETTRESILSQLPPVFVGGKKY